MKLKKILLSLVVLVVAAVLMSTTYSTTTSVRGWNSNKVYILPAQTITPSDQIDWVVQYINDNPNILAQFYATGDSTAVSIAVKGTNFDPGANIWEDIVTLTVSGATVDTTYAYSNKSTSLVSFYAYKFTITAGDTTTVSAALKMAP